jgi:DnaK suppressor protein
MPKAKQHDDVDAVVNGAAAGQAEDAANRPRAGTKAASSGKASSAAMTGADHEPDSASGAGGAIKKPGSASKAAARGAKPHSTPAVPEVTGTEPKEHAPRSATSTGADQKAASSEAGLATTPGPETGGAAPHGEASHAGNRASDHGRGMAQPKAPADAKKSKPKTKSEGPGRGGPPVPVVAGPERALFLQHQRELLGAERNNYTRQAEELMAQAAALALEHEPGDVQFDEEGGEGGTANVDRELDLHLSAQAQAAIEEIDAAMEKIEAGTYGFCESCANPIPEARLEALPHARLCVTCKSGGLTARRQ